MCNLINTYIHTCIHTYKQVSLILHWEDQCEWHRMIRMTGPDCAVNVQFNKYTYIHTYTHTYIYSYKHTNKPVGMGKERRTKIGSW